MIKKSPRDVSNTRENLYTFEGDFHDGLPHWYGVYTLLNNHPYVQNRQRIGYCVEWAVLHCTFDQWKPHTVEQEWSHFVIIDGKKTPIAVDQWVFLPTDHYENPTEYFVEAWFVVLGE